MNFRKGDTVSLQGVIKHNYDETDSDKRVFVDVIGSHDTLWMKPEDITLVGQLFEVGDSARWLVSGGQEVSYQYGTVLAINDDHAWIDLGNGDYCTRLLTTIERVEVNNDIA